MTVRELIIILKAFPQELKVELCMEVDGKDCGKCYGPIHAIGLSDKPGGLEICAADYDLLEKM